MEQKIKSLVIFCGARDGAQPHYREMAYELGKNLAQKNIKLVYGGGNIGLMGQVARGCLDNKGYVIGVIPEALITRELGLDDCQELHRVESMHERKALMADKADAFMAIPGGFGTLDEVFEIITWRQLQFHKKPIVFLNHHHYFSSLFEFCEKMKSEGFISDVDWKLIEIYDNLNDWISSWQKLNRL